MWMQRNLEKKSTWRALDANMLILLMDAEKQKVNFKKKVVCMLIE